MELWAILALLSVASLLLGLMLPKSRITASSGKISKSTSQTAIAANFINTGLSMPNTPMLAQWDETAITRHLAELRGQSPAVISHYIESVKQRMVTNQNDKTAAVRARFLKTKLEELKLLKEGRQVMVDLEAMALEREKRLKALELETQELDLQKQSLTVRQRLETLRDQKRLELEIAQLEKQIKDVNNPVQPEPQPTPQQQKEQRHAASEARMQKLQSLKQDALKIENLAERMQKVNSIDDELQKEMQEWGRTL
jgi:hypothetical protein